jgi:hypothetical protein
VPQLNRRWFEGARIYSDLAAIFSEKLTKGSTKRALQGSFAAVTGFCLMSSGGGLKKNSKKLVKNPGSKSLERS